jgi:predicted nucleic-acid-binding protein
MIAIDTNVLLRLYLRDDPAQTRKAEACLIAAAKDSPVMVNLIVLSEFAWTLARNKGLDRDAVADYIEQLIEADDIEIQNAGAARRALAAYRDGAADYPDYLLAAVNVELGCRTTMTFDRDALDYDAFSAVN